MNKYGLSSQALATALISCKEGENLFIYTDKNRPLWSVYCRKYREIWPLNHILLACRARPGFGSMVRSKQKTGMKNSVFGSDKPKDSVSQWSSVYLWAGEGLIRIEVRVIDLSERTEQRVMDYQWLPGKRASHKPLVKRGMSSCRSTWSPGCRSRSSRLSTCDPYWTCSWPCYPGRVHTDYWRQHFQITRPQQGCQQTKESEYLISGFNRLQFVFWCSF